VIARGGSSIPLGGLEVGHVVAFGASQAEGRLATYINAVQPLQKRFDGFMLDVYLGNGTPLDNSAAPGVGVHPGGSDHRSHPHPWASTGWHLLRDVGVPVFVVQFRKRIASHFPVRQPTPIRTGSGNSPGTAHGTVPSKEALRSSWDRDLGITPSSDGTNHRLQTPSRLNPVVQPHSSR